jgi:hypothetical protein
VRAYILESGEELNRLYPDSFHLPPRDRRYGLEPGELVKLIFRIETRAGEEVERMWVQVKGRGAKGYVGSLDNDPFCETSLKSGAEILFGPEHVIDIYETPV